MDDGISLTEWDIESEFAKFENVNSVHPWQCLTEKLCRELTVEIFRELVYLSKDALGKDYKTVLKDIERHGHYRFFEVLEQNYNEDVTQYLVNIFSLTNIHASSGVNIADKIKEYRAVEIKYKSKMQQYQLDRTSMVQGQIQR